MTHTPTPWKGTADSLSVTVRSVDRELPIAEMWENGDNPSDNAAFIVKAVNAHEDLVSALKAVRSSLIRLSWEENCIMIEGIDAALAKAGAL